jgi:hypothetical protein
VSGAREALERAIERGRPYCIECGSSVVVAVYRPALGGWIPQSWHAAACPVHWGGLAAWQYHEDLWAAIEPHLFLAHYGETAEAAVA